MLLPVAASENRTPSIQFHAFVDCAQDMAVAFVSVAGSDPDAAAQLVELLVTATRALEWQPDALDRLLQGEAPVEEGRAAEGTVEADLALIRDLEGILAELRMRTLLRGKLHSPAR